MSYWLAKSEPSTYSYPDLVRDTTTEWNGIHNASALLHLRKMRPGDSVLFYHSGEERSAVGIARVAAMPHPDPSDDRGSWSVEVRPVRALARPVSLAEMRGDRGLVGFVLFRMSRLSLMPVTPDQWRRILAHERGPAARSPEPQGKRLGSRSSHRAATARKRGAT
jgi:predicted RNA-binding protein with PUA-like domain